MGITAIADGAFAGMVNLTFLDLNSNSLNSISHGDLKDLISLKTLNLRSNKLAQLYNGTFQGLSLLESLSLAYNSLSFIEAGAFQGLSSVQSLSLESNSLSAIRSGTFKGLSQLRVLDVSSNILGDLTAVGAFSDMPELRTLNMGGQRSSRWHFGNGTFSGNFSKLTSLTLSILGAWKIIEYSGGGTSRSIVELGAFDALTGLETLDLHEGQLDVLPAGLFLQCRSLKTLNLYYNLLSTIADYTFAGLRSLEYLSLSKNRGLRTITEHTFAGLEDSLSSLRLFDNRITSISSKAFNGFKRLSWIELNYNLLSVFPLNVFMFANEPAYLSSGLRVDLEGNPLVCKPGTSSKILLTGAGSALPSCPSEVSFADQFHLLFSKCMQCF